MKFCLAALAAILLVATGASSAPANGEDWRFRDILELIQQRQAAGKPFQSPDELLEALPSGAKQWFTFIYQTNAAFQDASPQYPRAVVFTPHLVYAFDGHASQRGFNTLEFMELNEEKGRIELREIEFVRGTTGVQVKAPDETPVKCLQCHGASPRPIWHEYSDWTGVYGSSDDVLNETEKQGFSSFIAAIKADPKSRYAKLALPKGFLDGATYYSEGDYRTRVNLSVTKVLTRYNATRLLGLAKQSPYYDTLKWVLATSPGRYSSSACDSRNHTSADFEKQLDAILKARGLRLPGSFFDKVMLVLDLPPARFSPQTGKEDYTYEDGSYQMLNMFFDQVLRDVAKDDPAVAADLDTQGAYYHGEWEKYPIYKWIDSVYPRMSVKDCHYLQDKSDKAQQTTLALPPPAPANPSFEAQLKRSEEVRANPAIPIACVYCHTVSQGGAADGPHFAFDDTAALKAAITADNNRLLERLVARANPSAPDGLVMPPGNSQQFNKLTASEYADFTAYLRTLAK